MQFDLQRARLETPGCENVLHFNNAGAALMPQPVLDAIIAHTNREAKIGGYEAAEVARDLTEGVYEAASVLLGCHKDEIAVVESATRAWDMVFYSLPLKRGDRILTDMAVYASSYVAFLQVSRRTGATVEVIPNDGFGQVSIEALRNTIDKHVRLIALTHIPTNGGLINPAAAVGQVARQADVLYLLDACQSVGQVPIDVNILGCDMLSTTGRKYLRGPRGTGLLYVRRGVLEDLEPPFLDLHSAHWVGTNQFKIRRDARRFESWEANHAARIGLGTAIRYAMEWGLHVTWRRIHGLAEKLRIRLKSMPGVEVQDLGLRRCGIVTFTVADREPKAIRRALADYGINVWVSDASSARIDMEARGLNNLVRASVHYYNSEEEIESFCVALASILTRD